MNFSPRSRSKTRNSNVALLLPPALHNFSAIAPISHLDRITYRPNRQKRDFCVPRICAGTRKSFIALLLPHLFPVSASCASRTALRDALSHYSYKKRGGWGIRALGEANGTGGGGYPWLFASPHLFRAPRKFFFLMHLETKLQLRPSAPLLSPLESTNPAKRAPHLNSTASITYKIAPLLTPLESYRSGKSMGERRASCVPMTSIGRAGSLLTCAATSSCVRMRSPNSRKGPSNRRLS